MKWKVPYIDLGAQYQSLKPEIDAAVQRVLASGRYIGGEEVERFESNMAKYLGSKYVVSCGNGYDALFLALKSLGDKNGDEVYSSEYTHVSTHAAIVNNGAVFRSDAGIPDELVYRTKTWIPVHMNGRVNTRMLFNMEVIEDACQAIGASYKGKKAGTFGIAGCFSLHPMKVLGCAGDGGFVSTNESWVAENIMRLRNHGGGKGYGVNSRLDAVQAEILNVKLPHLDYWITRRRQIAARYHAELPAWIKKPPPPEDGPYYDTYSSYVVRNGRPLLDHLLEQGIECFSHILPECVSLPIYPEMKEAHVSMVIAAVKSCPEY